MALLAYYLLEVRGQRGAIVKTLSTTGMLNKLGKALQRAGLRNRCGIQIRCAQDDSRRTRLIGGEESGGYAFRGNVPERDGILAGLYMLDFMVQTGKKPTELLKLCLTKWAASISTTASIRPFSGNRDDREEDDPGRQSQKPSAGLKVTELVTVDGFQVQAGRWRLDADPLLRH